MPKDPIDKIRRLRQVDEVWEGTVRLARTWIVPKDAEPYRPYVALFVDDKGRVLASEVLEGAPSTELVWDALSRAMRRPMLGSGWARRPTAVYLDQEEFVQALAPRLKTIDIGCELRRSLPGLVEAFDSMNQWLNRGHEPFPGLITLPGVTPPLLEHLYAAAAEFYKQAPWRMLNDLHPIEIRYPPDAPARYAVVMGSGGDVYGLSIQDNLDDLQAMLQDAPAGILPRGMTWLALLYEEAMGMSFDDLDAITRYEWPMPSGHAYPIICRTEEAQQIKPPTRQDLLWLAAALPACVRYFEKHLRKSRGVARPVELTLSVSVLGRTEKVYLRCPALPLGEEKDSLTVSPLDTKSTRVRRGTKTRKIIRENLKKALMEDGPMSRELFEFELEEHIEEYLESKHADADGYFFAVTEHTGDVAMLLIDEKDVLHINEEARAILKKLWQDAYQGNMVKMIPGMARELDAGYLYIAGVKVVQ